MAYHDTGCKMLIHGTNMALGVLGYLCFECFDFGCHFCTLSAGMYVMERGGVGVGVGCCHANPDSKVRGTNMGPTWGRQDPGGPHVGHMNLAI